MKFFNAEAQRRRGAARFWEVGVGVRSWSLELESGGGVDFSWRSGGHRLQLKNRTSTCQWVEMREAKAKR